MSDNGLVGDRGLERSTTFPSDATIGSQRGVKTLTSTDPHLAELIAAWASLPPSGRATIMFRVRAATETPPAGGCS